MAEAQLRHLHCPGGLASNSVECRAAGAGPFYIKDHLAASRLDHARLLVLDLIGNLPFGGMVKASYLVAEDWHSGSQPHRGLPNRPANQRRLPLWQFRASLPESARGDDPMGFALTPAIQRTPRRRIRLIRT